ncbi:CRE-HOT-1 protein [Caenorhabditis remanei]|uniref:CRE-HOT-1 protein n=2 Tax=Caenorhabditis remanei TaxID=31234 RepID=E3MND3_CAERE|nr:CRE-HOT-1 protein [Caenorhabditis remanei]
MPSISSPVLLLLMLSLLNQRSWAQNTVVGPFLTSDTARCYSCMSKLYEAVWPSLSHIYKKPRNFTDDCDDERIAEGRVPIVHCPTICVSLFEQPNIAGVRIKGYIRGCMSDVLISGFNQTIVTWYRWMHRDSCRPYRKKELFKLGGDSPDDSTIDVCTCYADHCNGNSASPTSSLSIVFLMVLSWLLLV